MSVYNIFKFILEVNKVFYGIILNLCPLKFNFNCIIYIVFGVE